MDRWIHPTRKDQEVPGLPVLSTIEALLYDIATVRRSFAEVLDNSRVAFADQCPIETPTQGPELSSRIRSMEHRGPAQRSAGYPAEDMKLKRASDNPPCCWHDFGVGKLPQKEEVKSSDDLEPCLQRSVMLKSIGTNDRKHCWNSKQQRQSPEERRQQHSYYRRLPFGSPATTVVVPLLQYGIPGAMHLSVVSDPISPI